MPLLRRHPFIRENPPDDLDPDTEVFFCRVTKEIFTDYENFFERIILCNSLVWSCSITGRSGLTYHEALECEEKAKKNLSSFPLHLQKPVLYLATKTRRSRLVELNDDIFIFAKDRYFIGEVVEVIIQQERRTCEIIKVIPPPNTDKKNGEVIVIDDDDEEVNNSEYSDFGPDAQKYKYVVKEKKGGATSTVKAATISRKRGLYTRDKNKLFLKLHCEPVDGVWKVKEESIQKYKIQTCSFGNFYAGPLPSFAASISKKKAALKRPETSSSHSDASAPKKAKSKQNVSTKETTSKANPFLSEFGVDQNTFMKLSPDERAVLKEKVKQERLAEKIAKKEEMKKKMEEMKNKRREEKAKEREEQRKEKLQQIEFMREWNRVREDLECDDLKLMPEFTPVSTRLSSNLFGEAMHVLEFTHCFKSMFDFKQFFPKGFTYGMLESALLDNDTDGPLCDLLQMLLVAIFTLQEEEAEEVLELEKELNTSLKVEEETDESLTNQLIEQATSIAQIPQLMHGLPLKRMTLDQFTLSEILRLHLMSAGSKTTIRNSRFRYQQRGGYTSLDDAGLEFKMTDMALLKMLASETVYDLQPDQKLKIINTLLQQILSYAAIRDLIDESQEKLRQLRLDLKQLQWAEQRREKEESAARARQKQEEKMKEREKKMKMLLEQNKGKGANHENTTDQNENKMEEDDVAEGVKEAKLAKEKEKEAKKKAEFHKKEAELMCNLLEVQQVNAIYPLGRDRMYRRYWVFRSIHGIFVEDCELFLGDAGMLPGYQNPDRSKKITNDSKIPDLEAVDKNNTSSDKENDLCPESNGKGDNCIVISDDESKSGDTNDGPPVIQSLAAKQITDRPQHAWSFVAPGNLDQLLECLNPRGVRESSLKQTLVEYKPAIERSLDRCPTDELCLSSEDIEEARLKALSLTRGIASKKAAQDTVKRETAGMEIELNLRDAILDIEDRMFAGSLGFVKVDDRFAWRSNIESSEELLNGDCNGDKSNDGESNSDKDVVKVLARALYDISEGIEQRYLSQPLKEGDSKKKSKKKKKTKEEEKMEAEDSDDSKEEERKRLVFDRWQESLLNATSLSQVYLHLSTFEKSVMWDKSALHARCRICRRKGDAERMLLCDGCDRGHHMDCLKPPVKKVPVGDWFCPNCRPKEVIRSPRKGRRRTFTEEEEEDDSDEDGENDEEEEEEEQEESEDDEIKEEESEAENDESMSIEEDENENVCSVCSKQGMLICCDCCPKSFHLACAQPSLKKIPRGKWMCQYCLGYDKVGKVKIGKKATSKQKLSLGHRESPRHSPASTPRSSTKGDSDDETPSRSSKSKRSTPKSQSEDYGKKKMSSSRGNSKISSMKAVEDLVADLVKHDDAWPFLKPVNKREVPDYYKIIKEPMDFQTIKNKIHKFEYTEVNQILDDIRLIFFNCVEYNNRNTPQYKSGAILNKYFQRCVKDLDIDTSETSPTGKRAKNQ